MKTKVVFFGSSKYSVIVARKLHEEFRLSLIVTTQKSSPPEKFAIANRINFKVFDKLDDNAISQIKSYEPDFIVVADYGKILPVSLLKIPRYDSLNVHHSLLPKYRGPSPAPSAILNGEKITGVTIISMEELVDAGPVFVQKKYEIKNNDTTDSLLTELNSLGGDLVAQTIKQYIKGDLKPQQQDHSKATLTKLLQKNDGLINFDSPPSPVRIDRMIRAFCPWPGAFFKYKFDNKEKIIKLLPKNKIQVEGKNPMSYKDFMNGYKEGGNIIKKLQIQNSK
ncbi:MAG: methionyl-tRNA formyltransferase [Patescibacteria group bacterium]